MKNAFVGSIQSNCYLLLSLQDGLEPWGRSIYPNQQIIRCQVSETPNPTMKNYLALMLNKISKAIPSLHPIQVFLIEIRLVRFVSFVWSSSNKFFWFLCSPENAFGCALFLTPLGHRLVDPHDLHPGVAAPHGGVHPPSYPVILTTFTSSLAAQGILLAWVAILAECTLVQTQSLAEWMIITGSSKTQLGSRE